MRNSCTCFIFHKSGLRFKECLLKFRHAEFSPGLRNDFVNLPVIFNCFKHKQPSFLLNDAVTLKIINTHFIGLLEQIFHVFNTNVAGKDIFYII